MGRPASRPRNGRSSGGCYTPYGNSIDIAGITTERAAERSGSEWTSSTSETPSFGDTEESDEEVSFEEQHSREAEPQHESLAKGADPTERHVLLLLFTDYPGFETKPVHARLVVIDRPVENLCVFCEDGSWCKPKLTSISSKGTPTPTQTSSPGGTDTLKECMASHAGGWPAWDEKDASRRKY